MQEGTSILVDNLYKKITELEAENTNLREQLRISKQESEQFRLKEINPELPFHNLKPGKTIIHINADQNHIRSALEDRFGIGS